MEGNFVIVTDSCSDLDESYAKEHDIRVIPIMYTINGVTHVYSFYDDGIKRDFFEKVVGGSLPKTAQPSTETICDVFRTAAIQEKPVLYISLSSSFSGTFNGANLAKRMVLEEYPHARIECFNSNNVSLGQSLFVYEAVRLRQSGKNTDEVLETLTEKRNNQKNLVMIKDLFHLKRGGRISSAQAAIGSMLKVIPILQVNEGKVEIVQKLRGKRKAMNLLKQYVINNMKNSEFQTLAICHANSPSEAEQLKNLIESEIPIKEIQVSSIGPIVGTHVGSGALAVFFLD